MEVADRLANAVSRVLFAQRQEFVAAAHETNDALTELKQELSNLTLPRVAVRVQETVLDVRKADSTAESELTSLMLAANLKVTELEDDDLPARLEEYLVMPGHSPVSLRNVDVVIFGRAVGEFGLRTGDLVSAKGWVQFTAVDVSTKRVLAMSSIEQKGIDVVPQGAAIRAISEATRESAKELVPKFIREWNERH